RGSAPCARLRARARRNADRPLRSRGLELGDTRRARRADRAVAPGPTPVVQRTSPEPPAPLRRHRPVGQRHRRALVRHQHGPRRRESARTGTDRMSGRRGSAIAEALVAAGLGAVAAAILVATTVTTARGVCRSADISMALDLASEQLERLRLAPTPDGQDAP